jgi:hypothetical protein
MAAVRGFHDLAIVFWASTCHGFLGIESTFDGHFRRRPPVIAYKGDIGMVEQMSLMAIEKAVLQAALVEIAREHRQTLSGRRVAYPMGGNW